MTVREPAFVISTGRSGSTLLSRMLSLHPEVLNLSELFSTLMPLAFPRMPIDGFDFWRILSEPRERFTLIFRHGLQTPEMLYPVNGGRRFDVETGVPPLLVTTFPSLTANYEELFDVCRRFVETQPERPVAHHYSTLFDWLAARFDRPRVVERSGGSAAWIDHLLAAFPGGRFVHLHRDGPETVLSMRAHNGYRFDHAMRHLARVLRADPFDNDFVTGRRLPPSWLEPLMPSTFDVDAFNAMTVPLEDIARRWVWQSDLVARRLAVNRTQGRALDLSFEELIGEPASTLRRLALFLGFSAEQSWLTQCASLIEAPTSRLSILDDAEAARLRKLCTSDRSPDYG